MSGPRAIVRHVRRTLAPNQEPDAEPQTYAMLCVVCGESSAAAEDWDAPQGWALSHSGHNPSHHTYRELITRPWRTWRAS